MSRINQKQSAADEKRRREQDFSAQRFGARFRADGYGPFAGKFSHFRTRKAAELYIESEYKGHAQITDMNDPNDKP